MLGGRDCILNSHDPKSLTPVAMLFLGGAAAVTAALALQRHSPKHSADEVA